MNKIVRRIFVEKKKGFDVEAQAFHADIKENLEINTLASVRIVNRYDVEGISDEEYRASRDTIFSEPPVDTVYDEKLYIAPEEKVIAVEYLPGQYDQRADSTSQCIQILTRGEKPVCRVAKLIILSGDVSENEYNRIMNYCINPVESREASLEKPLTLDMKVTAPEDVETLEGFIKLPDASLEKMISSRPCNVFGGFEVLPRSFSGY